MLFYRKILILLQTPLFFKEYPSEVFDWYHLKHRLKIYTKVCPNLSISSRTTENAKNVLSKWQYRQKLTFSSYIPRYKAFLSHSTSTNLGKDTPITPQMPWLPKYEIPTFLAFLVWKKGSIFAELVIENYFSQNTLNTEHSYLCTWIGLAELLSKAF